LPNSFLGMLSALTSAAVWGSGDFSGGLASRRGNQHQVLVVVTLSGALLLAILTLILRETLPTGWPLFLAAAAGLAGGLGIAFLYRGLSIDRAATVAPVAAVITGVVPVLYSSLSQGLPNLWQLIGFALALAGIFLVSRSPEADAEPGSRAPHNTSAGLLMAVCAGIGFGGFFVLLPASAPGQVFAPLLIARLASLVMALVLLVSRRAPFPIPTAHPIAILAGVLDSGGNIFYAFAKQYTRLDVAAVLSSFYPAATVLLAWIILKERVAALQWLGAALCLVAVPLIAL
jgi:drug/metabolite transporter (DMT)-like permease